MGTYNHIDTINEGSAAFGLHPGLRGVRQVRNGIMYECVRQQVPLCVGGLCLGMTAPCLRCTATSIRDRMRALVRKATTIICMAHPPHTVATGNMTPCYRVVDGQVRPPAFYYSVDISEFAVNKLRDRGACRSRPL